MSKLAELKQKMETLTLQMQFFCLDPQYQIFQEICKTRLIKAGKYADIWKLAVLDTYGDKWLEEGYIDRDETDLDEMDKLTETFESAKDKLLTQVQKKPTRSNIDQLWYLFFATGKSSLLVHIYKAMGDDRVNKRFAEDMADMYINFTIEYRKKIQEIENKPQYISSHQIGPDHFRDLIKNFKAIMTVLELEQTKVQNKVGDNSSSSNPSLGTTAELEKIVLK